MTRPAPSDDLVQPFGIEASGLRGRLVRLGPMLDTILGRHEYPAPVAELLGQAIALAVALASALKYDGIFTLQTKGDGPVKLLVVDVTTDGAVRGYARFEADAVARLGSEESGRAQLKGPVPRLLGSGYLAFTVDQGEDTERYQGLVALEGATLADCVHHYFRQSEQIATAIKVAIDRGADGAWRGGALMIQRLPQEPETAPAGEAEARDDGWRRALVLMGSSTAAELTDSALSPDRLLYRLFHEDGVRVFRRHAVRAQCRCSRARIERVLHSLPAADRAGLGEPDGTLTVTCEFCNTRYRFDAEAVAAIAATPAMP